MITDSKIYLSEKYLNRIKFRNTTKFFIGLLSRSIIYIKYALVDDTF